MISFTTASLSSVGVQIQTINECVSDPHQLSFYRSLLPFSHSLPSEMEHMTTDIDLPLLRYTNLTQVLSQGKKLPKHTYCVVVIIITKIFCYLFRVTRKAVKQLFLMNVEMKCGPFRMTKWKTICRSEHSQSGRSVPSYSI